MAIADTITQYLEVTKKAISGRTKFLAARIDRDYVHVEHIKRSTLGINSDATIILKYAVEYAVGYDLSPESFTVAGDAAEVCCQDDGASGTRRQEVRGHNFPSPSSSRLVETVWVRENPGNRSFSATPNPAAISMANRVQFSNLAGVPAVPVKEKLVSKCAAPRPPACTSKCAPPVRGRGPIYQRYKDVGGKTCHQNVGRTLDLTLADARRRAKALRAEIALGADPPRTGQGAALSARIARPSR